MAIVKVNKASDCKVSILKGLRKQAKQIILDNELDLFEKSLKELYAITYKLWDDIRDDTDEDLQVKPTTKFDFKIRVDSKLSVSLTLKTSAVDSSGNLHDLWYWIDLGNEPVDEMPETVVFPRRPNRTTPNQLEVDPASGDDDEFASIKEGEGREALDPRFWSRTIAERFRKEIEGKSLFGRKGWKVVKIVTLNAEE